MGYIILLAMLGTIIYYGYQGFKVIKDAEDGAWACVRLTK